VRRRGALLLEMLLALALFVAASAFTLSVARSSISSAERARGAAEAMDLAVTLLNQLELQEINVQEILEGGGHDDMPWWSVEIDTEVSSIPNLTLVAMSVHGDVTSVTIRRLVNLRGTSTEAAP